MKIETVSLRELLSMRETARKGRKTPFTIAEINAESDRRHQSNLTFQDRLARYTHQINL